jgi:Mrp family chromosome partitioning ATPase
MSLLDLRRGIRCTFCGFLEGCFLAEAHVKIITLLNEKGGVGKTTLATHIAAGLSILGHRVLLVEGARVL